MVRKGTLVVLFSLAALLALACGRLRSYSAPAAPSLLTTYPHWQGNNLVWQVPAGTVASLVVRDTSPITWTPTNGHTYVTGTNVAAEVGHWRSSGSIPQVVYFGGESSIVDNGLSNSNTYYYAIFCFDGRRYSAPVTFTAPAGPGIVGYGGGWILAAAYQNGYYYAIASHYGILVFSGADQDQLNLVGASPLSHQYYRIVVSGNYAYLGSDEGRLVVADISNPAQVKEVGEIVLNDVANLDTMGLAVIGTHVFLADRQGNIYSVDVSTPTAPILDDTYVTGSFAPSMTKLGNHLVTITSNKVDVVDASDPKNLVSLGNTALSLNPVRTTAISSTLMAFSDFGANISLLDVSTPTAATVVGTYAAASNSAYVYAIGNSLLVNDSAGLKTVNVATPSAPALQNTYPHPARVKWETTVGDSNRVVIAGRDALRVFDVTAPASPVLKATHHHPADALQAAAYGGYLFVGGASGFGVIDGRALQLNLQIAGGAGYVVNGHYLKYLDAVASSNANDCSILRIAGHYLHCAGAGGDAYAIFDISTPSSPVLVGQSAALPTFANGMAISGNYAYVMLGGTTGLKIYDISDPAAPTLKSTYNTSITNGYGVSVNGHYAYIADNGSAATNGLHIIDVSNPSSPTLAGELTHGTQTDIGGIYDGPAFNGNYAFAPAYNALSFQSLLVIDIANLAAPSIVASKSVAGGLSAVTYRDGYLFGIGSGISLNFYIYDVSNPLSPSLVASPELGNNGYSIVLDQGHAWIPSTDHVQVYAGLPGY